MMTVLIRWTVQDRYGNTVYLTEERWQHIIEVINHPEMEDCEDELKETVHLGARRQDPLNPQKYRYTKAFDNLARPVNGKLRGPKSAFCMRME